MQLPNGNGATTFSAPFVSDIVPVFVDLKVGGSQETGNHAPSVILQASQDGGIVNKVVPGSSVVLTAVGSDLDESDRTMLSTTWEVTAGTLDNGSSDFEKTWKAPDYQTLATITVEVKDPKGAVGVARLPILVGIDNPSQYDGARPSVTLGCEVTQVADSAAFVVSIAFDEMVSDFALEDISLTNCTADNFSTVTAGRAYSVRVKPQAAGAVTIAVGENVARDVAGNGNRASNVVTVTNNIAPVLSSEKALTAFSFSNKGVVGTIDETNKTVAVTVPFGTDVSALIANFSVSANATAKIGSVAQVSGINIHDFSSPVVYKVIAEDGSSANYTVTVTVTGPVLVSALDLSSLVTAPVKGAVPVTTAINQAQYTSGAISWFEADGTTAVTGNFAAAKVYVAKLALTAKAGYTLTGVAANSFNYTGATSVANAANSGAVTITFAATADAVVDSLNLSSLVTAPVKGAAPVTTAINQAQYTSGAISWFEADGTTAVTGNFAAAKVYVAKLALTAKAGYTLTGVAANSFTYTGATSVANAANSGAVTITFAATANSVVDALNLSSLVTAPVKGAAPVTTAINQAQYTSGAISWFEADGTTAVTGNFAAAKVYVAKLTLSAKAGYTLTGVAANSFTYTGATSVANAANSGAITITFAATADAVVDALNLSSLVTAPVKGATPVTTAIDQTQYTSGAISWFEADGTTAVTGNFAAAKVYVAKLTLAAKAGYTLTGVSVNSFTYTGATSVANAANSGAVTITFSATAFEPVTAIGAIAGIPISGQTLTAGALTPAGATADYKWQVSADGSTGWTDIAGATGNTYVVDLAKTAIGQYVRVVATGNGTYGATVNSAAVKIVTSVTAIGAVSGVPMGGQTLTAGALTPAGATADYKWQVSNDGSNGWADVDGATANTYVVDLAKTAVGKYVRAVAAGNGNFGGVVNSAAEKIQGMPTMVSVPAGTFQRDATPANTSFVSAFSMSAHEITRAQFARFMGTDPSNTSYSNGNADPVQMTNWYHAIAFCNKLSLAEGLTPVYAVSGVDFAALTYGAIPTTTDATWDAATCNWSANGYRLPTEMEWMWAAMGADQDSQPGAMVSGVNVTGYAKTFAGSNGSNSLDAYAWYSTNSSSKTHPAGAKSANELGLYDMSGNVYEWCWDWYNTYPAGSSSDYSGAGSGSYRVLRGGSFGSSADYATVAGRSGAYPYSLNFYIGFRVVRP